MKILFHKTIKILIGFSLILLLFYMLKITNIESQTQIPTSTALYIISEKTKIVVENILIEYVKTDAFNNELSWKIKFFFPDSNILIKKFVNNINWTMFFLNIENLNKQQTLDYICNQFKIFINSPEHFYSGYILLFFTISGIIVILYHEYN